MYDRTRYVAFAHDGTVWVSTESDTLHFDGKKWYAYRVQTEAITVDSLGTLWLATYDGRLFRFDDHTWTEYTIVDD
jgi:hypothetical protein